jgi:AmiR/NasT family two-component response regulator
MNRLKIIVADDESIIRMGLKAMLTSLGHEVFLASNGREALQLARTIEADLAILDIQMPLTDGLEAAKVIARKHPMPILILTAYGQQDLIDRAVALPIQGYLVKPVNEQDLAAAMGVAVARFEETQKILRETQKLQGNLESRKVIDRAKGILTQNGLSEEAAYQLIQQQAREAQVSMRQIAENIVNDTAAKNQILTR